MLLTMRVPAWPVFLLSVGLWQGASAVPVRNTTNLEAFQSCLLEAGTELYLHFFEQDPDPLSGYTYYNYQWELLKPLITPAAFLLVDSVADVQNAVRCGRASGVPVVAKGGGHHYEKYSFGSPDSVILDMMRLNQLVIDAPAKTFTVGTGALLAHMAWPLYTNNLVSPHGTCPTVGVAGLALGGGYGYLSRTYGLTTDTVLELQLVDADGNLRTVNRSTNSDLFWALKGCGTGSFGVVTSLKMRAFEAPKAIIFGEASYPTADFIGVFDRWQRFVHSYPTKEINSKLSVGHGVVKVEIFEVQERPGEEEAGLERVHLYLSQFPPTESLSISAMDYPAFLLKTMHAHVFGISHPSEFTSLNRRSNTPKRFKAKSFFVNEDLNQETLRVLQAQLDAIPEPEDLVIEIYVLGGQINDPEAYGESCFMHRSQSFYLVQVFYEYRPSERESDAEASLAWLRQFYAVATTVTSSTASYGNYADGDLSDYLERYYGWHLPRLQQIKRNVDPTNFFNHPQSIPPA